MKGYKVVKEDHIHHGFKYQEGLNVDTKPFRAEGSCVPGGLYFFTDIKDVPDFLDYGVYLYEVEVPDNYPYVSINTKFSINKCRAKALILSNPLDLRQISTWEKLGIPWYNSKKRPNLKILDWAVSNKGNLFAKHMVGSNKEDIYSMFIFAVESGNLELCKDVLESGLDQISIINGINQAGTYGQEHIVSLLVSYCSDPTDSLLLSTRYGCLPGVIHSINAGADVNCYMSAPLERALTKGLPMVKYLVEKGSNIPSHILYWARVHNNLGILNYLESVGSNYEGV